ncbi:MAG: J domain-containing protein [Campylobacterota bacterium]|nr:J domain-containing protein [Campylobacterota bacterium]
MIVPLEKIVKGGEAEVRISHLRTCPACKGSGAKEGTSPRICEMCNGTGKIVTSRQEGNISYKETRICPNCGGKGKFIDTPCPKCGGTGVIDEPEKLMVNIPIGAEEGMVLRVPSKGRPGTTPDQIPGDLLVVIGTAYDQNFKRSGADLWHTETIDSIDAVLGTKIKVSTLDGSIDVKIPKGTQPNTVLRVKNKGLPYFGNTHMGDFYLRLEVHIPQALSDKEIELYKQLQSLKK